MTDQRFGSYRVVRQLGEGGMGLVFEAVHEEIGKRAAIKVLHASFSRDPQVAARFLTEARAVNLVQHPGLVSVFELGRTPEGGAYLVMEFLEGETIRARLERLQRLPAADALRIVRQIAGALAAAHDKSVVHRDLKPENVMLVPEPELPGGERAKILDFGIAKVVQQPSTARTQVGAVLGTPAYMAPEQGLSAGEVDEKADIYALGAMLYELLAGAPPFSGNSLVEIMMQHLHTPVPPLQKKLPEISEGLQSLVEKMLAKERSERPSARDIVRAIDLLNAAAAAAPPAASLAATLPTRSGTPAGAASGAAIPALAMGASPAASSSALARRNPGAYVHRGTPATTFENFVYLDHPLINGDPNALLWITPSWNPGGQGGTYNNHHTGVWYAQNGRWSIYNEDRIALSPSAAFNVLASRAGFVHQASAANIINNWTLLDHPSCNNRPDALLLITANWNPGGQGGTYNNHALGVWYTQGRWSIFNQDRIPLPPLASWNVLVAEGTFCHRVTQQNLIGVNGTFIDHPAARGNPDAVILVTPNWNPGGQGGLYHDHPIGVYYCLDRWAIFNQDMAPMPPGAAFNVWIG